MKVKPRCVPRIELCTKSLLITLFPASVNELLQIGAPETVNESVLAAVAVRLNDTTELPPTLYVAAPEPVMLIVPNAPDDPAVLA